MKRVQPYRRWLEPVIRSIDGGQRTIVLSVLTEAELLVHPLRQGDDQALDLVQAFVEHESVSVLGVDRALAQSAASIRARYNLTLVDSAIVATAVLSGCDVLVGNDKRCAERVTEIPYIYLDEVAKA